MRAVTAQFIDGSAGRLFTLMRRPAQATRGGVLIVPPFAEEMNKSRKMFTDLSQALLNRGVATVVVDLYGTGDSDGEFRDADWQCWVDDVVRAAGWAAREGCPILALLGLRTGCLLAARAATGLRGIERTVFLQPVRDGGGYLMQFLRLGMAAAMMEGRNTSAAEFREQIRRDGCAEIAGYEISARLAEQLETLRLESEIGRSLGRVHWIEVVRGSESALSSASQMIVERALRAGLNIDTQAIAGEPFWLSTEIVRSSELVAATADALAPRGQ